MRRHPQSDYLDHVLREALTAPPDITEPSARVSLVVMSQIRREAGTSAATRAGLTNLLAQLLFCGVVLAWTVVRLSFALWPGLAGLLQLPALDVTGGATWWFLRQIGATLLSLVSHDFGGLFPLALLVCLALAPLAVVRSGRSAS